MSMLKELPPFERHLAQTVALRGERMRDEGTGELPMAIADPSGPEDDTVPQMELAAAEYVAEAGWALCLIPRGAKGPRGRGWNELKNTIRTLDDVFKLEKLRGEFNLGLCHRYALTCAIDVDNYGVAKAWLAERGADLDALLNAPDAVKITSGRPGRAKLLYSMPAVRYPGDAAFRTWLRSFACAPYTNKDGEERKALEFRNASRDGKTVQDVLPPSIHPETGRPYEWELGPRAKWYAPPVIPDSLLAIWLAETALPDHKAERRTRERAAEVRTLVEQHKLDELRELLSAYPSNIGYLDDEANGLLGWQSVLAVIHQETRGSDEGLALAVEWSEPYWDSEHSKYASCEAEVRAKWGSYGKTDRPLTIASLQAAVRAKQAREQSEQLFRELCDVPAATDAEAEIGPVEFVIDWFVRTGITTIAGWTGVGKTTLLVPLAAAVAQLYESELPVELRRRVIYLTEDPEQVKAARYAIYKHAPGARPWPEFLEWFQVVQAQRLAPKVLAETIAKVNEAHTVVHPSGYSVRPLIILDTANATIDVDNENDNAEIGRAISAIRSVLGTGAVWIVCHTAKALRRADVEDLTVRGGGAWEADANGSAYIFEEPDIPHKRFLALRKRRFRAAFTELEAEVQTFEKRVKTPWGTEQARVYEYAALRLSTAAARLQERETRKQLTAAAEEAKLRDAIVDLLAAKGEPLSLKPIREALRVGDARALTALESLIAEGVVSASKRGKGTVYQLVEFVECGSEKPAWRGQ